MRTLYLLACLLLTVLVSVQAHAQTNYGFTYDACGNRLTRAVIQLKSAKIPSDTLTAKQAPNALFDKIGLQQTRIYPNPTKGLLRIEFPELSKQDATIRLYSSSGKLIIQKPGASAGNEIDLSSYPMGFYIMTLQVGENKKEWKIIKE